MKKKIDADRVIEEIKNNSKGVYLSDENYNPVYRVVIETSKVLEIIRNGSEEIGERLDGE